MKTVREALWEQGKTLVTKSEPGPEEVVVVAASKGQSIEVIVEMADLGISCFGENYLQEALEKMERLRHLSLSWHYIGRIQTNKVRKMVGEFDLIQSVDRKKVLSVLNDVAREKGLVQKILLQMGIFDEETKGGFSEAELLDVATSFKDYKNLKLCGLMAFPPLEDSPEERRRHFSRARELFLKVAKILESLDFKILSMGTSSDYKEAIMEGANMVRLGTVLMGERRA